MIAGHVGENREPEHIRARLHRELQISKVLITMTLQKVKGQNIYCHMHSEEKTKKSKEIMILKPDMTQI